MMFDGSIKSKRHINLGGKNSSNVGKDRTAVLRQAQEERKKREEQRQRELATSKIQVRKFKIAWTSREFAK
jgi:hypothetical protein